MLKEIHEQPQAVTETLTGRLLDGGAVDLDEVHFPPGFARALDRIWITACGTALHAGLVGKEVLEGLLRVPVEVAYAHELRYRDPLIQGPGSLTVAISQSGETADTLAAAGSGQGARLAAAGTDQRGGLHPESRGRRPPLHPGRARDRGGLHQGLPDHAGRRVPAGPGAGPGAGHDRPADVDAELVDGLRTLPRVVEETLDREEAVIALAERFAGHDDVYFIGRGLDYAVAMEGSLKMKEISYIHSEAMPAGELKHGTLALVTEGTPVVVVLTQGDLYDKTISALQEVKARRAFTVAAMAYEDDTEIRQARRRGAAHPPRPRPAGPGPGDRPTATARLPRGLGPGARHRSAAEPGQERDGRVGSRRSPGRQVARPEGWQPVCRVAD